MGVSADCIELIPEKHLKGILEHHASKNEEVPEDTWITWRKVAYNDKLRLEKLEDTEVKLDSEVRETSN